MSHFYRSYRRRRAIKRQRRTPVMVASGRLAYYPILDETMADSSNGPHGQLGTTSGVDTSDPTPVPGGLLFDGSDDVVQLPSAVGVASLLTHTIQLVVKSGYANAATHTVVLYGEGTTGDTTFLSIGRGPGNTVLVRYRDTAAPAYDVSVSSPAESLSPTAYQLMTVRRSGTTVDVIIGNLTTTTTLTGLENRALPARDNRWLSTPAGGGMPAAGAMTLGAMLTYNRALSDAEIQQNYTLLMAQQQQKLDAVVGTIQPRVSRQIVQALSTTVSTATLALTIPGGVTVAAGATLGLAIVAGNARTASSIADTKSNTWSVDGSGVQGTATGVSIASCRVTTPLVAGDIVTITYNANSDVRLATLFEMADLVTSGSLKDVTTFSGGASVTTVTTGQVTTTTARSLLIGVFGSSTSLPTLTFSDGSVSAPLVSQSSTGGTINRAQLAGWRDVIGIGPYSIDGTFNTAKTYASVIVAYKGRVR